MTPDEATLFQTVFDIMRENTMTEEEVMILIAVARELRVSAISTHQRELLNSALAPFERLN